MVKAAYPVPEDLPTPAEDEARTVELLAEIKQIAARGVDTSAVWLPLKKAAEFAGGYCDETIRLWCERGLVRSLREGAKILVDVLDLIRRLPACGRSSGDLEIWKLTDSARLTMRG